MKRSPLKKKKLKSISSLKKTLDSLFSLHIRNKYADWKGYCTCYTCGKVAPVKEMQCGHYVSRSCLSTRWDENNCRVQCPGCNVFKHGNYPAYTEHLLNEIGEEALKAIIRKGRSIQHFGRFELENEIAKYK